MTKNIKNLLQKIATQESALLQTQLIAPCVKNGKVRTRVAGLIYTFTPEPTDFEGWGIFQPQNEKTAQVLGEPSFAELAEYLQLFKPMRLHLIERLVNQTWLTYPVNEGDAKQRLGFVKPMLLNLVTEGVAFDVVIGRFDGSVWWFEEVDRRIDPVLGESMRSAFKKLIAPPDLQIKGMTPELRTIYEMVYRKTKEARAKMQKDQDEMRLEQALKQGGGALTNFADRGNFWQVEWTTRDGQRHTSAISKTDLTVISSGICLSGRDRDFDLQSLVGVIESR